MILRIMAKSTSTNRRIVKAPEPAPGPSPQVKAVIDAAGDARKKFPDEIREKAVALAREGKFTREIGTELGIPKEKWQNIGNWAKAAGVVMNLERQGGTGPAKSASRYGSGSQHTSGSALDRIKALKAQIQSEKHALEVEREGLLKRVEEIDAELSELG